MHKLTILYAMVLAVTLAISSMADVGFGPCCGGSGGRPIEEQPSEQPVKDSRLHTTTPIKLAALQPHACRPSTARAHTAPLCLPR